MNLYINEESRKTKSENIKLCACISSCYSNYGITGPDPTRFCFMIWVEFIIHLMVSFKFCYSHTVIKSWSALLRSGQEIYENKTNCWRRKRKNNPLFFHLKSWTFQTKYKTGFRILCFSGKKDMTLPAVFLLLLLFFLGFGVEDLFISDLWSYLRHHFYRKVIKNFIKSKKKRVKNYVIWK